ncbi:hypothetical protein [Kineococcus gynurae]
MLQGLEREALERAAVGAVLHEEGSEPALNAIFIDLLARGLVTATWPAGAELPTEVAITTAGRNALRAHHAAARHLSEARDMLPR